MNDELPLAYHIQAGKNISAMLQKERAAKAIPAAGPARPRCISELFSPAPWRGQPVFIVCGGPSLRGFDWTELEGRLVIGVNKAYEVIDPAILFAMDQDFVIEADAGQYGDESHQKWRALKATKVFYRQWDTLKEWWHVDRSGQPAMPKSLTDGFPDANNSGMGALLLAAAMGADPIYLLGLDMHGDPATGKQVHFHGGYGPRQHPNNVYPRMIEQFNAYAAALLQRVQIYNCNPNSALRCFPFAPMPTKPDPMPIIVGFYTRGNGYEIEALAMEQSVHRFGLRCELTAIEDLGSWQRNTVYKARFLRDMVSKHEGETIVYVDADARFRAFPALFSSRNMLGDVAYHRHVTDELLSGTLVLRCNTATEALCDRWVHECEEWPARWEQQNLDAALRETPNVEISALSREYCNIFDYQPLCERPVISQYQASRRLKREPK